MDDSQKLKISFLESQLNRILELTTRADTKASILLAFLGVIMAAGISKESLTALTRIANQIQNYDSILIAILLSIVLALPYLLLISGFIFLVLSLFARIDKRYGKISSSNLFFNKISDYQIFSEFEKSFNNTLNALETNF